MNWLFGRLRIRVQGQPRQKVSKTPSQQKKGGHGGALLLCSDSKKHKIE
jgi:hypothetical protein